MNFAWFAELTRTVGKLKLLASLIPRLSSKEEYTALFVSLGMRLAAGLGMRLAAGLGMRLAAGLGMRLATGLGMRLAAGLGMRLAAGLNTQND